MLTVRQVLYRGLMVTWYCWSSQFDRVDWTDVDGGHQADTDRLQHLHWRDVFCPHWNSNENTGRKFSVRARSSSCCCWPSLPAVSAGLTGLNGPGLSLSPRPAPEPRTHRDTARTLSHSSAHIEISSFSSLNTRTISSFSSLNTRTITSVQSVLHWSFCYARKA